MTMKNWSTDTKELEKDKESFAIWKREQMINFGLDGEKISLADLRNYWEKLDIDPRKKKFLAMFT